MFKVAKKVIQKLQEYGFDITDEHKIEDTNQYGIYTTSMIIQIDEDEKSMGVSFHSNLRPELAAQYLMILQEIDVTKISIMEPFYYGKDGKFSVGEEARNENMRDITKAIVEEQQKIAKLLVMETYNA